MGILDGLSGTVGNLLGTFGQEVTFTTYTESFDPVAGKNERTPKTTKVRAMVEDYPAMVTRAGSDAGDGVVRGDKKVTVAASAYTPTVESKVTIGGAQYSVIKVDTQYGTDDALLYVCQARR